MNLLINLLIISQVCEALAVITLLNSTQTKNMKVYQQSAFQEKLKNIHQWLYNICTYIYESIIWSTFFYNYLVLMLSDYVYGTKHDII